MALDAPLKQVQNVGGISDLIQYRLRNEKLVRRAAEAVVPTAIAGEFRSYVYENDIDHVDHVALVKARSGPTTPSSCAYTASV